MSQIDLSWVVPTEYDDHTPTVPHLLPYSDIAGFSVYRSDDGAPGALVSPSGPAWLPAAGPDVDGRVYFTDASPPAAGVEAGYAVIVHTPVDESDATAIVAITVPSTKPKPATGLTVVFVP